MQTVKMVVTGPFNSGKTEFISSVSEIDVVSTERKISAEAERIKETTTVAMDFGRITVDDDLQIREYLVAMGWDTKTGKPKKATLKKLGLEFAAKDM